MSSPNVSTEKDYDPIKNPRPEDLHAYGIGSGLLWLGGLSAIGFAVYWLLIR